MTFIESFVTEDEQSLTKEFLEKGYVIRNVARRDVLDAMRHRTVEVVCAYLNVDLPADDGVFLNTLHERVPVENLNDLRLHVYAKMNSHTWFRPSYFGLARPYIEALVGNELAMQGKINYSIQYPNDESSLLGVHADTWSGESPFQIVEWLPLVDVYDTKSMYILDPGNNDRVLKELQHIAREGGSDLLFERYRDKFKWLSISYGQVLVFNPSLLHGNIVNTTTETRWSLNTRLKGLFTPYFTAEKSLGNFYLPVTTKAATRVGIDYKNPEGFK